MIKILFVCHGNICRSPMAEFVMKDMVAKLGREGEFQIASAATSREELGNPVHPGARKKLAEAGICCDSKRAVQVKKEDYDKYDLLVVMDQRNIGNILRIFGNDPDHKIHRLLSFSGGAGDGGDIADPWYTGNFDVAYDDIMRGCRGILAWLNQKEDGGDAL